MTARSRCGTAGTGERLSTLVPGGPNVWAAVEFQADGHTLLIAGRDGAVRSVDTRLESWIDRACDVAGRNLAEDEWAEAVGDRPYRETCAPRPTNAGVPTAPLTD